MHFLYVIKSIAHHRTYIGTTFDIPKRLREHNTGQVKSTKFYRPYRLIHQESFRTKTEARKREFALKNNSYEKERLFRMLGME